MAEIIHHSVELKKSYLDIFKDSLTLEMRSIVEKHHERALKIHLDNDYAGGELFKNEIDNWLYTTYFYFCILQNYFIDFKCIETEIIVRSTYSSFFIYENDPNHKIIYYYFPNGEKSFVLFFGAIYNVPIGVYYLETNKFYGLVYGNFGGIYNCTSEIVNNFLKVVDRKKMETNEGNSKKRVFFFGNNFQPGHYLWNEVSGIEILISSGLIDKIDTLVVCEWDMYDLYKIIQKYNPKCNIVFYKDFIQTNDLENNIYCQVGDFCILKETKDMMLNEVEFMEDYAPDKCKLLLNLKIDNRRLENTLEIYVKIINKLIEDNFIKPEKLFLIIEGLYVNDNDRSRSFYNTYSERYSEALKYIVDNINPNIEYISLIGKKATEVIKYYKNLDYFIGQCCSNTDPIKWIFSKDGCMFTYNEYVFLDHLGRFYVEDVKKYNVLYGPVINEQTHFRIDFEVLYEEVSSFFINNASRFS